MAPIEIDWNAPRYAAARRFVDQALREDGSLFTPGSPVWTQPNIEQARKAFVDSPDTSGDSFEAKLARQVEGMGDPSKQVLAEILFVHLLTPADIGGRRKREQISSILSTMDRPVTIPPELDAALDWGFSSAGVAFKTLKFFQLKFLIEVAERWKQSPDEARGDALTDPYAFKRFLLGIDIDRAYAQLHALLHLVHPSTFESIVSRSHKEKIVRAFDDRVATGSEDVDRQIGDIRRSLEKEHGRSINFYLDPEIARQWLGGPWANEQFFHWVRRFWETDHDSVRQYLQERIAEIVPAKDALLRSDSSWRSILSAGLGRSDNLLNFRLLDPLRGWFGSQAAEDALLALWSPGSVEERMTTFLDALPVDAVSGQGTRLKVATYLLGATDITEVPLYQPDPLNKAMLLADEAKMSDNTTASQRFVRATTFYDSLLGQARDRDIHLRDRLDAKTAAWCVAERKKKPEEWSDTEWAELLRFRSGDTVGPGPGPNGPLIPEWIATLAEELFLDPPFLNEIAELLEDKNQVIFYGPPGTGKTYVALALARELAGEGSVKLVQFHPSYAYEDFIEGFRPGPSGQGFELVPGPLREIAQQAESDPHNKYLLVIDEINRGNIAKVFGELYFLLEYRDEEISLQYSRSPFTVPDNLYVIGTMNTADRSIALMDAALRRRFHFVGFLPTDDSVGQVLPRWLEANAPGLSWVADVVDRVNAGLDKHSAIGPSHFLKAGLTEDKVRMIWKHSIVPYIEEMFFGEEERVADFQLDRLRDAMGPDTTPQKIEGTLDV